VSACRIRRQRPMVDVVDVVTVQQLQQQQQQLLLLLLQSTWSPCSAGCGNGFRSRSRSCSTTQCAGNDQQWAPCNTVPCQGPYYGTVYRLLVFTVLMGVYPPDHPPMLSSRSNCFVSMYLRLWRIALSLRLSVSYGSTLVNILTSHGLG